MDDTSLDIQDIRAKCLDTLRDAFERETGWVKIHAAEALLDQGERDLVDTGLTAVTQPWEGSSQIGFWRVMCGNARDPLGKQFWVEQIESCYADEDGQFRLNALESLCKLRFVANGVTLETLRRDATIRSSPEAPFALWALHLAGDEDAAFQIGELLASGDSTTRMLCAFCLRWMKCREPAVLQTLADLAENEPQASPARLFLLSAAAALNADPRCFAKWKEHLIDLLKTANPAGSFEICHALKDKFTRADAETLLVLIDRPEADVRIGSSAAFLHLIERQAEPHCQDTRQL